MALINCPNCGARISDKARKCPKCGVEPKQRVEEKQIAEDSHTVEVDSTPENQQVPQNLKEHAEPSSRKPWWIAFSIIVVIIVGSIFVSLYTRQNEQVTSTEEVEKENVVELTPAFIEAVHQYDELYPFSEGLAAVIKDDKFGFINTKGELVVSCKYRYAGQFKEGLAFAYKEEDDYIGFIDATGKTLHTNYPLNSYIQLRSDGGKYFGSAISFKNGVCEIKYLLDNEELTVYIDKQMKEVAQPTQLTTQPEENLGYEIFSVSAKDIYGKEKDLYGVKDKDGKIVIPANYNKLEMGDNGVLLAKIWIDCAENIFNDGYWYCEGLLIYGYIDLTTGKSTFTPDDMAEIEAYKQEQLAILSKLKSESAPDTVPIYEQEEKVEKCPEWLQGNWRCQTQYGEARVGISGDIISVWFDGEHFYTGSFEVRNNELVYDRRNGSAYTLQFDRRRKCLMMDDNHPMSRF